MFLGIDWTFVNWTDVAALIAVSAALSVAALLAIRYLPIIPPARKRLVSFFALLIVWTPVGLITPGVAYGEWVPEQGFQQLPGVGYLPVGIDKLSRLWKAPFAFYQLPWVGQNAPVSQQAPGYIISAILGVLFVVGATLLVGRLLAKGEASEASATSDIRTGSSDPRT